MSSSSSDEEELDPATAERRARALMLLAKVKREREPERKGASSSGEEEAQFLRSLQTSASRDEMLRSIRDRLSVLDVNLGATPVAATPLRAGQAPKTAGEKDAVVAARARAAADEAAAEAAAVKAEADLRAELTRLCDGDLAGLAAHAVEPEFWRREAMAQSGVHTCAPTGPQAGGGGAAGLLKRAALPAAVAAVAAAGLAVTLGAKRPAAAALAAAAAVMAAAGLRTSRGGRTAELRVPEDELRRMGASLNASGFGVAQPERWGWGEDQVRLEQLRQAAHALARRGWPPAFVFMLDEAWDVVDGLWPPMRGLLGDDCAMDPSVFCWIARPPAAPPPAAPQPADAPASAVGKPAAGANFGTPHRDFTCLQSLRKDDGAPLLLSVWLPLCDVTADNGCMMVVPRQVRRGRRDEGEIWSGSHMQRRSLPASLRRVIARARRRRTHTTRCSDGRRRETTMPTPTPVRRPRLSAVHYPFISPFITRPASPQLDPHYTKRFAYAHMRPALASDDDDEVTELRFELQAARPLAPLRAGSLVAWCGNVIHWGTRCSAGAEPRVSVGFNFLRKGEALQSASPPLSQARYASRFVCSRGRPCVLTSAVRSLDVA